MPADDEHDGLSVRTMVGGVMLLVAWLCWAMAASAYFGSQFDETVADTVSGRGRGLSMMMAMAVSFVVNSLRLHEAPAIVTHTLRHEQWIPLMFFILMGSAVLFGLWVKKLESQLAGPSRKRRRKRKRRDG